MVGAVLFAGVGFGVGAFASAYVSYDDYASPWRKLRVEHEGLRGEAGRTRVIIQNPKMPVQAVDVTTTAAGLPASARVSLKNGQELEMTFDEKGRATSLTGPDGAVARYTFDAGMMRVAFFGADGAPTGVRKITIPTPLLTTRADAAPGRGALARAVDAVGEAIVPSAFAQPSGGGDDSPITVTRNVLISLDVRAGSGELATPGKASLDATCSLPNAKIACVPNTREISTPGVSEITVAVTGSVDKKSLTTPESDDMAPFREHAKEERKEAAHDLPHVARVMSALGVTAIGCRTLSLTSSLCIKEFRSDSAIAGGAISAFLEFDLGADTASVEQRARRLFDEDRARLQLDKAVHVEVCVSRDRAARVCSTVDGRAFAESPLQKATRAVDLKTDLAATLAGSFVMTQSDGGDCKFSPSPRTGGPLKLSFDDEKGAVSASMSTVEQGIRQNLSCSMGTANMGWNQSYSITATQSFTKDQLHSGGTLPLKLVGTMSGSGGYGFSNCRSSGGVSGQCPGGKNEGYSYPVEIVGEINLATHVGSGTIIVKNAPLTTSGTWRVPAEAKAP